MVKVKNLYKIEIEKAIGGYSVEVRYDGIAYGSKNYVFKNGEEQEMLEFMIKLLGNKKLQIAKVE